MSIQQVTKAKLHYRKETDGTYRWDTKIAGALLALYVKKWRVPEPCPPTITVEIALPGVGAASTDFPEGVFLIQPELLRRPMNLVVEFERKHTQTIRYTTGFGKLLGIQHIYIPFARTFGGAGRLEVTVRWE
jgi:hypothetical protein